MAGRPRLLRCSKEALPIRSNTKSSLADFSDAFNGLLLATFQIRFHLKLHRAGPAVFSLLPIWHRVKLSRGGATIQRAFQLRISDSGMRIKQTTGWFESAILLGMARESAVRNPQSAITKILPTSFAIPDDHAPVSTSPFQRLFPECSQSLRT